MSPIKAVIFDLGGVMVTLDTGGEYFGGLMRKLGFEPAAAMSTFWSTPDVVSYMTGGIPPETFFEKTRRRYGLDLSNEAFSRGWCDLFRPMPGMAELFARLGKVCRIGVLSDTDPLHWQRIKEISPCLKTVSRPTLSHEVGHLKPHPAMYAAAVRDIGCDAENCLFTDDKQTNVDGALRAGLQAIRFEGADAFAAELAKRGLVL